MKKFYFFESPKNNAMMMTLRRRRIPFTRTRSVEPFAICAAASPLSLSLFRSTELASGGPQLANEKSTPIWHGTERGGGGGGGGAIQGQNEGQMGGRAAYHALEHLRKTVHKWLSHICRTPLRFCLQHNKGLIGKPNNVIDCLIHDYSRVQGITSTT